MEAETIKNHERESIEFTWKRKRWINSSLLIICWPCISNVIISDTILCSLAPPQLHPMADNQKIMCGCAICNTSKYMQESLNAWRRKQLKNHEILSREFTWKGKRWINSSLLIMFWLCLSREKNSSSMLRKCSRFCSFYTN